MNIPPIHTRFDLVWKLTDMDGVMLRRINLWQVPLVGEIINIGGTPYRVINTSGSLPDEDEIGHSSPVQWAFVKVQKASSFTVNLGGTEY